MRRVIVLLLLSSLACVRYKRVSIERGNPEGDACLQTCKQAHDSDDEILACASACPGALVQNDAGECPTAVDGEPECVSTVHVRWGRIAKISGVIVVSVLIVTGLLLAFGSAPTH